MSAESWSVDLLDRHDRLITPLSGVLAGGRLEWSIFRAVWGSASLQWNEPPDADIDWLSSRVRIWHHVGERRRPMGIWIPAVPAWRHVAGRRSTELSLLDKTEVLNQPVGAHSPVQAGTNVVDHVRWLLAARGETRIGIEPNPETLPTTLWFEPQDTWLQVCTRLLAAIGHESLHVDMDGVWRSGRYRAPEERPIAATYGGAEGDLLVRDEWSDEANLYHTPNVVKLSTRGDEDTMGMRAVARNTNPDSPLSVPRRGREIVHTEEVEATSQAALQAIAERRLAEVSQVTRRVPIQHPVDDTRLNDVVHFRPLDLSGPVVQREIQMGVGAVVTDTIRRIYTGGDAPW